MDTSAFLYSEALARFDYGDDHPFKPIRARNTMELCHRYGLLYARSVIRPEPSACDLDRLRRFHTDDYLDILIRTESGEHDLAMLERGIGTPDCPMLQGIMPFSLLATGATLYGVDLVLQGMATRAFNLVGGFHHAFRDHAEGFCYVNDIGVAIEELRRLGKRVAFIDIDAHHCNGVQDAFYDDDRVLVVSLHESGDTLYPFRGYETELGEGKGRGFNVNIPLLERSDDDVYLDTFRQIVPPLLNAYSPDIVLAEIGADTMVSDPLTHLRLTTNGYYAVMKALCTASPKLVAVGGGGYDIFRTARCWTLAFAAMTDIEPEDDYAGAIGGLVYGADMNSLFDRKLETTGEAKDNARAHADRVVRYVQETVFPVLGARRP